MASQFAAGLLPEIKLGVRGIWMIAKFEEGFGSQAKEAVKPKKTSCSRNQPRRLKYPNHSKWGEDHSGCGVYGDYRNKLRERRTNGDAWEGPEWEEWQKSCCKPCT